MPQSRRVVCVICFSIVGLVCFLLFSVLQLCVAECASFRLTVFFPFPSPSPMQDDCSAAQGRRCDAGHILHLQAGGHVQKHIRASWHLSNPRSHGAMRLGQHKHDGGGYGHTFVKKKRQRVVKKSLPVFIIERQMCPCDKNSASATWTDGEPGNRAWKTGQDDRKHRQGYREFVLLRCLSKTSARLRK